MISWRGDERGCRRECAPPVPWARGTEIPFFPVKPSNREFRRFSPHNREGVRHGWIKTNITAITAVIIFIIVLIGVAALLTGIIQNFSAGTNSLSALALGGVIALLGVKWIRILGPGA